MKAIFTRKEFALAVACALAFGLLSEMASAGSRGNPTGTATVERPLDAGP